MEIYPLGPYSDLAELLETMYRQLYPSRNISRFYRKCGRATIAGGLVGSDMPGPNSTTSAIIMAYWPSRGSSLGSIDYGRMQVGVVQYFIHHTLQYGQETNEEKNE